MQDDAHAPGVLREFSVSPHGACMYALTTGRERGDRREERGERKGVRAEAFHHDYRKVDARDPAPIVAPSPVATQDAMMSLAAIEHLDFEAEIPCDGSLDGELCQNAAFGVVVALCRGCRQGGRSFICRRCWSECQAVGWICPSCDRHCESRFILLVVTFR